MLIKTQGHHLQPTRQQVDSRQIRARQWSRGVQSAIDRLYHKIMRGPREAGETQ